jgi:hypothetical protein
VKSPVDVDIVVKLAFVPVCTAETLAPGTAAPEASSTEPVIVPRSVWARAAAAANVRESVKHTVKLNKGPHEGPALRMNFT